MSKTSLEGDKWDLWLNTTFFRGDVGYFRHIFNTRWAEEVDVEVINFGFIPLEIASRLPRHIEIRDVTIILLVCVIFSQLDFAYKQRLPILTD